MQMGGPTEHDEGSLLDRLFDELDRLTLMGRDASDHHQQMGEVVAAYQRYRAWQRLARDLAGPHSLRAMLGLDTWVRDRENAIAAARRAEREACAKLIETKSFEHPPAVLAHMIRTRDETSDAG